VLWKYGAFVQTIVDFAIVAFAIFLVVKAMNTMQKKQEAAPAPPSPEVTLLTEIRDTLRQR
jgi:large conductance mechanosensitive channel